MHRKTIVLFWVIFALLCGDFLEACCAGEPITNNAEWTDKAAGKIRVYGANRFSLGTDNAWRDIDPSVVEGKTLSGVAYSARTRLTKPVLFRRGDAGAGVQKNNCVVITGDGPGWDKHRLEISLGDVKFGGVVQPTSLSDPDLSDKNLTDMGGIKVLTTSSRATILLYGTDAIKEFFIGFDIKAVGLEYEPHPEAGVFWFTYPDGRFFAELSRPELLDTKTLEPILANGPAMALPMDAVGHSMEDLGSGRFRYTKFSKAGFDKLSLPKEFFIDAQVASETSDGWIYNGNGSTWANAREACNGCLPNCAGCVTTATTNTTRHTESLFASYINPQYFCVRNYFFFDLSGLSGAVSSATIGIYGYSKNDEDYVMAQTSTAAAPLDVTDYLAFANIDAGTWGSLSPASWNASGYNVFAANSTGLSDIQAAMGGTICVCIRQDTHDYQDSAPAADVRSGITYADYGSNGPYLDITVSQGNKIIMVD